MNDTPTSNVFSLHFKNFKSFGPEGATIEDFPAITIIIGRNNSGKSATLDAIEYICEPKTIPTSQNHANSKPTFTIRKKLNEQELKLVFSPDRMDGPIAGNHWIVAGKKLIGSTIGVEVQQKSTVKFNEIIVGSEPVNLAKGFEAHLEHLAQRIGNPFLSYTFARLSSERDIKRESADLTSMRVDRNGNGLTYAIHNILSSAALPSALVEESLLREINKVFKPDSQFTRIRTQQGDDGFWEIFLDEEGKGSIPLSNSGSGLKTILLVTSFFTISTHIIGPTPLSKFFFGFEELETNLHPALQRRLMNYIREKTIEHRCKTIITTHSSVIIDQFAKDENAQILHVRHNGTSSSIRRAITYVERSGVVDDLDVRASDLLQSNGIIWVEGPSDRLYFNRWIELFSGGVMKEGTHYQCVFYGGRLLAHLSASIPEEEADLIKIFNVNRNALIIIDSDKKSESARINDTKKRLVKEFDDTAQKSWITDGREIENYLPASSLAIAFGTATKQCDPYRDFDEYLQVEVSNDASKLYKRSKTMFADKVTPHLSKENVLSVPKLHRRIEDAIRCISKWNGGRL